MTMWFPVAVKGFGRVHSMASMRHLKIFFDLMVDRLGVARVVRFSSVVNRFAVA